MQNRTTRARLSLLAVTSSLATIGGGLAMAAPAMAVTGGVAPTATETLTGTGATADVNGNLSVQDAATTTTPYSVSVALADKPAATPTGIKIATASLDCGLTPSAPVSVAALVGAGGKATDKCSFTAPGTYKISFTATDNQIPAVPTTVTKTVTISAPGPVVTNVISAPGVTADANGNLAITGTSATVTSTYSIKQDSTTPLPLASGTLSCGITGVGPVNLLAGSTTGAAGTSTCTFNAPGTYTIVVAASDNEATPKTASVTRTVTITSPAGLNSKVDRYDGASRYGTGVSVSQAAFPTNGSAGAVVLARGDVFADALAGIPLAKDKNGPLLLTPGGAGVTALDPNVSAELVRVLPKGKTVFLLGGIAAIPQSVETQITNLGYTVVRLSGATRFDTALAVAQDPRALNNPGKVVVARGDDFADALASGPFASNADKDSLGNPAAILLINGAGTTASPASIEPTVASYIEARLGTAGGVTAIGGGAKAAVTALPGSAGHFTSYAGLDRFGTAELVAAAGWNTGGATPTSNATNVGVATGLNFADALTGGAYMALKDGPLLLTDPSLSPSLSVAASGYVTGDRSSITDVSVFGGTAVIPLPITNSLITTLGVPSGNYIDHHVAF